MAFNLAQPYTLRSPGATMTDACVVEQAGEFYALRLNLAGTAEVGPIPYDALGPYATVEDAAAHVSDLPPPPPAPPLEPPFIPPPPEVAPSDEEPSA